MEDHKDTFNKHWHVYYCDGYYDDGNVGFESFRTKEEAVDFIEKRLAFKGSGAYVNNYTLIEGMIRELETVEVTTKVCVKR